jgi:hypothetical protein
MADSAPATVTLLASSAANSPPAFEPISDQSVNEGQVLAFVLRANDPDMPLQYLTFSFDSGAPNGANLDPNTGLFTWSPSEAQGPGIYPVTVRATDNGAPPLSAVAQLNLIVNEVNQPPSLTPMADHGVAPGALLSFQIFASDTDLPEQRLTFSLGAGAPAGVTLDPNTGLFTWTPAPETAGQRFVLTVTATDNGSPALSASQSFTITVVAPPPPADVPPTANSAPVLAPVSDRVARPGETLTFTASATDAESPPQQLTFALGAGAPAGARIDGARGVFTWVLSMTQMPGEFSITIIVTDNGAPPLSASRTFRVQVPGPNTRPILASIEDRTIEEGQTLSFPVLAADRDVPAQHLSYTLDSGAPAGANLDPETLIFSWTPTEAQGPGSNRITVRVTDDGEPPLSDARSFTVIVTEVNSPPSIARISDQTARLGQTLSFTATATDPDLPSQTLTFALGETPVGATIDARTGLFVWTPSTNQPAGPVLAQIIVRDNGTPAGSATQSVRINFVAALRMHIHRRVNENEFQIELEGAPNACYRIEASTDLLRWTPSASGAADASGRFTFTERRAPSVNSKYYRALEIPCTSPPGVPRILQPTLPSQNEIQLVVEGAPDACYRVESTTDFRRWTPILTGSADATGRLVATVRRDPAASAAFYRVVVISCEVAQSPEISKPEITSPGLIRFSRHGAQNTCSILEGTSDFLMWKSVSIQ